MARIRSDKPEAYQSETLAEISLAAERTFKGMATIADDRGRLADKPAQINGELWSMRGGHDKDDLDAELTEMVKVDLVCRYTGCDGKRYLHLVKWDAHQKIDRPSKSRLPRCPVHQGAADYCGLHDGDCPSPSTREYSRGLQHDETGHEHAGRAVATPDAASPVDNSRHREGVTLIGSIEPVDQGKRNSSRDTREPSMQDLGSRILDLGSRTVDQEQRASVRELPPEAPVDAFELTDALRRWAHSTHPGLDLEFETDQFRRYYRSTGAERRSWPAAWQKWIADSHKRITQARASPPRLSTTDQRVAQAEALKAELRNGAR